MEEKKKTDLQAQYPEQSQEEPGLQSKMILCRMMVLKRTLGLIG